ncbi:MAG: hypothetical protein GTN35_02025 [Nitrososphaeria archaeon]|nr:hypothetical protein [Nitrosopumilaceae archaeon]NIP09300.1 hypothetical protein [Nitrosopumilaceae archaeon]NIP91173.1 hypothetical protein [Nitrososphaeria archaeon]NIS94467.1 hypothetical protein [Nitrosopumilaceae archaeon]
MKTIAVVAIAILCAVGVLFAVFVMGGAYQQELFDDYLEDSQNPPSQRPQSPVNMPSFDVP